MSGANKIAIDATPHAGKGFLLPGVDATAKAVQQRGAFTFVDRDFLSACGSP